MDGFSITRRFVALGALLLLAGCTSEFRIAYDRPIDAAASQGWTVSEVRVSVPKSLTSSEAKSIAPAADIVWREDPEGDRHAQVAAIIRNAAQQGAAGLKGPRRVRLEITVIRFHALTFEAENRLSNAGVHNIDFTATVVDAATGSVLAGPAAIEADVPAFAGAEAKAARAAGQTQRSVITSGIRRTIAGWLGVGPDPRGSFKRPGV